ncbi:hypothetical protein RHGRI_031026 [Rhododendron griersonianum]|uniref:Uncharacterized protein n=1 Tax=Rhododendron griersonianum TaxID=479676 RepID=A0AAV6I682_9ERIC|nr:hypothetical protein RHGRI_031026 [Rhododendron griersonianum]
MLKIQSQNQSSDEEDNDDEDKNDDMDDDRDSRTNSLKDKVGVSKGILEGDATYAVLGTTNRQTNQHGDKTMNEGGVVEQNQKSLTQEDGKRKEENTKSPVPLDKGVSRVEDYVGLNTGQVGGQ